MLSIEKIEIEDFRGVKKLALNLKYKNFGICGPNGTGKSGIVDAIEFAITGDITRLRGSGTSDLSVRAHGPHVDAAKNPNQAKVTLTARIPSLGKMVTIERSVGSPNSPKITPTDKSIEAVIAELAAHPEFALSRREIIKYILTPAGQRSKDVQELMRLEHVEKVRQAFQKIANDARSKASMAKNQLDGAIRGLLQALGIPALSKSALLKAVNDQRAILQLTPLADLSAETDLKTGLAAGTVTTATPIRKAVATAEIEAFNQTRLVLGSPSFGKSVADAAGLVKALAENTPLLKSFRREVLIKQGVELLEEDACPLCDLPWNTAELLVHLQEKLSLVGEATKALDAIQAAITPLKAELVAFEQGARKLLSIGARLDPKIETALMSDALEKWTEWRQLIEGVCNDPNDLQQALEAFGSITKPLPTAAQQVISAIAACVAALPEVSKEQDATAFLILAQERLRQYREARSANDTANARQETAKKVSDLYSARSTAVLEGIYKTVEKDFTDFYRLINSEDEGKFEGALKPSVGKLAFDVDFYGRGQFPPGAYHSEGHQDGMGLCLYLALMKHTLGSNFTFAVLDDVLMSVDSSHRREVCKLLKSQFPKVQFILTTHDPVWLQFMRTENLVGTSVNFGSWSVDTGPQVWDHVDIWKDISDRLAKNDVAGAAAALRRYLEFITTILADNLRADVPFQSNGSYDLGDLMSPVLKAWRATLALARESAQSWGNSSAQATIVALEADAKAKIAKTQTEQWMINKAVHYNEWANLQPKELASLVAAFKDLLDSLRCTNVDCGGYSYVSPHKGDRQALRCTCGSINFNLIKK
ncbi:AAA family ATPase [Bradyrhizobium hipponense]|uniref:AAA family ATPase n=1 Tax=Bradyrhizobium hipponense TaxID=2605638 RepID=A0A5S4YC60_9BRAD|nr:AAA family ATPase [Bradyrhizobium hipponense]TYO61087.1 AAA family ATPase [Bradyrhizobium hipponense]